MARRHKLLAGFLAVLVAGVALAYLTIDDEAPAFESPGEADTRDGASRLRVSAAWRESRARALVLEIDRFRPPPPRSPS